VRDSVRLSVHLQQQRSEIMPASRWHWRPALPDKAATAVGLVSVGSRDVGVLGALNLVELVHLEL